MDDSPEPAAPEPSERGLQKLRRMVLGGPKDIEDPRLFHTLSLAAFLAWVGLGADGLSSSSYGPEEAFKNLGEHQYLAVFLALVTGLTVFINFPAEWHAWKLPVELAAIAVLTVLNLRGIKESIRVLMPIFLTFLVTH